MYSGSIHTEYWWYCNIHNHTYFLDKSQVKSFWSMLAMYSRKLQISGYVQVEMKQNHYFAMVHIIREETQSTVKSNYKCLFLDVLFFKCLFWERVSTWMGEGQRVRERENPKQALCCQHTAQRRARSHEPPIHDLSWNQELDT